MTTPALTERRSRRALLLITIAILLVGGGAVFFAWNWAPGLSRLQAASGRVRVGMTLAEVEAILGPGLEVGSVPEYQTGPVVQGDVFYRWTATELYGEEFIVGFKAGVVFDKWYRNLNYL